MKAKGFSALPLSASKTHKYGALALWGTFGYFVGVAVVASAVGDF